MSADSQVQVFILNSFSKRFQLPPRAQHSTWYYGVTVEWPPSCTGGLDYFPVSPVPQLPGRTPERGLGSCHPLPAGTGPAHTEVTPGGQGLW
jgi:hypothetical protein